MFDTAMIYENDSVIFPFCLCLSWHFPQWNVRTAIAFKKEIDFTLNCVWTEMFTHNALVTIVCDDDWIRIINFSFVLICNWINFEVSKLWVKKERTIQPQTHAYAFLKDGHQKFINCLVFQNWEARWNHLPFFISLHFLFHLIFKISPITQTI